MPAIIFVWFLIASLLFPITTDEAYYFEWARNLAWGYLDHPPAVAWISSIPHFPRLGGLLCTLGTIAILNRLYKSAGLKGARLEIAMTCLLCNFAFLALGIITTPDSVLAFFWALALHETFFALKRPVRWLSVGLSVGLGMLSKYTMILFLPALLWVIVRERPHILKTRWPWLGLAVALLTFSPNLLWNYQHDWVSFKFQWSHGFNHERPALPTDEKTYFQLPHAQPGDPNSALAQRIPIEPRGTQDQPITNKILEQAQGDSYYSLCSQSTPSFNTIFEASLVQTTASWQDTFRSYLRPGQHLTLWQQSLYRLFLYIQGQLSFWGFLLFGFIFMSRRKRQHIQHYSLFQTTFWFPVGFFGVVALNSHVEPNWPAMALLSAPALIASQLHMTSKTMNIAMCNIAVMALALVHTHYPLRTGGDRLLKETHGFEKLAQLTEKIEEPLFADKYQLVSMLNQYRTSPDVAQWPGITRYSHFLLQPLRGPQPVNFTFITTEKVPPEISGYTPTNVVKVRDCLESFEIVKESSSQTSCKPLHIWYLIKYEGEASQLQISHQKGTTEKQKPSV